MIRNKVKFASVALLTMASALSATASNGNADAAVVNALKAHMSFLADDRLKGRETGSNELEIAAGYIASQFQLYGLKPGGDNGSYLQSVPLIKSTAQSSEMVVNAKGRDIHFESPKDFVSLSSVVSEKVDVRAELVFAGYGIDSKGLKHNDYADIDVKGKIAVILIDRPAHFPSAAGAHASNIFEKAKVAAKYGAVGLITLNTPMNEKARPYAVFAQFASKPMVKWQQKDGTAFEGIGQIKSSTFVSIGAGKKLFQAAGFDLEKIFAKAANGESPKGFDLNIEASLTQKSKHQVIQSNNVIGIIEGSDKALKNEYVVYTAHHDGVGMNKEGIVNNGALDNASGVALILETARRFGEGKPPKRSVMFIGLTAEENGLQGSSYYAQNPTVPIASIVANINLDMPFIFHPFADVVAFGAEHSTMGGFVQRAVAPMGLKLSPDPVPKQAAFVRSDHYSFVKQGVPAVFLTPGFSSTDPKVNGGQMVGMFLAEHYHKPSDDMSLPFNFPAAARFMRVNHAIGSDIANTSERPKWHQGDFFGELFGRD